MPTDEQLREMARAGFEVACANIDRHRSVVLEPSAAFRSALIEAETWSRILANLDGTRLPFDEPEYATELADQEAYETDHAQEWRERREP